MLSNLIRTGLLTSIIFAVIYLVIWLNRKSQVAYLFFVFSAVSVAAFAENELREIGAVSVAQFVSIRHGAHLTSWFIVVSFALFINYYMRAGRLWLFWIATAVRTASTVIDQFCPFSINYSSISAIRQVNFLGDSIAVADATPNPLMVIAQVGLILFLLYCADAVWSVYRRGNRRFALATGGGILFFSLFSLVGVILINWNLIELPLIASPFFMGILAVMGYDLTSQVLRSHELSVELDEERARSFSHLRSLTVAAEAGNVGVRIINMETGKIVANPRWREMFAFPESAELTFDLYLSRIHPGDRDLVSDRLRHASDSSEVYEWDYRIVTPAGEIRWINSRGKVEVSEDGSRMIYGASADVTRLKSAEIVSHYLSERLIEAQEDERARVARELHDDLGQSLALLSIEVDRLLLHTSNDQSVGQKLEFLAARIRSVSSDVRRISHTLHPALLKQLGLVSALREFCHEFERSSKIIVTFTDSDVPKSLPDEIALCLFRITQESLQNVAKHSGSDSAKVDILYRDGELILTITDKGKGFDPQPQVTRTSLGLINMEERARMVHGELSIDSRAGLGTLVTARVPVS